MQPPQQTTSDKPPLWRGLVPLIVIGLLASNEAVVTAYGEICKPIALFILGLMGFSTLDHGSYFTVAHLEVPWTRDCAGMNLLLVLLAMFAWINRNVKQDRKYWLRMLAVLPPAIAANVLRVLTLIFYRFAVYPEVESPQLHYFFGFIWLIPFALLSIPRHSERSKKAFWFELVHISAVLGLIAPLLSLPNHWITLVGALLCMTQSHFKESFQKSHLVLTAGWIALALAIAWSGIESLWLPWLLVCPLTIHFRWLMQPQGLACLATSCPLFVLIPGANILAIGIFAYTLYAWTNQKKSESKSSLMPLSLNWERTLSTLCAPLLFLPFLASLLFSIHTQHIQPPEQVEKRVINGMGYELRLKGQPHNLGLIWYDPQGSDRHHAVEVCLKYRGVELKQSEVHEVKTDEIHWYREFFIVDNELIDNYKSYIESTLGFRQNPGVHLIIIAKHEHFEANDFADHAGALAQQLIQNIHEELTPHAEAQELAHQ